MATQGTAPITPGTGANVAIYTATWNSVTGVEIQANALVDPTSLLSPTISAITSGNINDAGNALLVTGRVAVSNFPARTQYLNQTAIAASTTVSSAWFDSTITGASSVGATYNALGGGTATLYVDNADTQDGNNLTNPVSSTVSNNGTQYVFSGTLSARYYRLRIVNGTTAQTSLNAGMTSSLAPASAVNIAGAGGNQAAVRFATDGFAAGQYGLVVNSLGYGYNGSTWDQLRSSIAGTSVAASSAGILAIQGVTTGVPLPVVLEPVKATYTASFTALAAAFAGDLVVLTGSGTKTVRLRRVVISGTATTAAGIDMSITKRTTADTAGTTVTAPTIMLHDSGSVGATATIAGYSAAPTPGTAAGILVSWKEQFLASGTYNDSVVWDFNVPTGLGSPVLRGTTQQYAITTSAALTGGSVDVSVTWTEE